MPSKYRKRSIAKKQWYKENQEHVKSSRHIMYMQNMEAVKSRSKIRKLEDKLTKKKNAECDKKRYKTNAQYRSKKIQAIQRIRCIDATHKQNSNDRATCKSRKRLQDAEYQKKRYHNDVHYKIAKKTATVLANKRKNPARCIIKTEHDSKKEYWIRRSRLLRMAGAKKAAFCLQLKMQTQSGISILDIKLLFNKADRNIKRANHKIKQLHASLVNKVSQCLTAIPNDRAATEDNIVQAFGGIRAHNSSSEPYFWEQSSKLLTLQEVLPIHVDGRVNIFNELNSKYEMSTVEDQFQSSAEHPSEQKYWQCNPQVCNITNVSIENVVNLLQKIVSVKYPSCAQFYTDITRCENSGCITDKLGHSLHCPSDSSCTSLLQPARVMSCHFPLLRTLVRRVYELRQIVILVQSVKKAMTSGSFDKLKQATDGIEKVLRTNCRIDNDAQKSCRKVIIDEDLIMAKHGNALREVCKLRDSYTTRACDVCEQLRKDLVSLKSLEGKRGYDSEKMTNITDLLYQNKTEHEDIEMFLTDTLICRYCADKLKGNKDVARSAFNQLRVIPTPECISSLNLFEKLLIKFSMTCLTIVRLGQISNKHRPKNELTSALKGRIAYLPVDVAANGTFIPHNLLNLDSLVLLVGGQPTKKNTVWTSTVDLRKVQAALIWLKENNKLYKDIPTYTIQDLEKIVHDKQNNVKNEKVTDRALLKKLDDASRSNLYENFSVQPLSIDYPLDALVDYQLDKVQGNGADLFDTDLDLKSYPELYPTGEHGMRDAKRDVKIATSDFIKSRLLNKDSKFRLNINYLFHCFQTQEVSNMAHSVSHMLKCVSGKTLTAQAFRDRLQNRDGEIQNKMFSLMANLRGSKEYFAKLSMNIRWMIKQLGPPTLFITLSTAEWFSEPFIEYLRTINSSVPNVQKMTPAELCAMDPVHVSIHFQQKWHAIFNKLIKAKDNPLFGEVIDHFWRIEYQSRGAPHVHCVLWIKDAPVLGKNSADEVSEYIQKIATCAKPDPITSPTLSSLVSRFQTHKCNRYCTKVYKHKGKFYRKCRFGFPRPVKDGLVINDVIDCLAVSKNKQPRKRLYHLQREENEIYINDYNPTLLLANQANVDIQYIGHLGSRLPYYITEYMTKHERSEQDNLWQDIFASTKSLGTNAMSFMLKSVKSRQVGANEAADRLLGHKLYSMSRQIRFADLQPADKAKRVLKPVSEIDQLLKIDPATIDIFQPHWVIDIYPDRPDELADCSLHEFLGWYEREVSTGSSDKPDKLKLKTFQFTLRHRRNRPYIVTHQTVNPHHSEENRELYHYYMLKLFKPWRTEMELQLPGKTFFETFVLLKDGLPAMAQYHEMNVKLSQQDAANEKAVQERCKQLLDESQVDDEEGCLHGLAVDQVQTAMQDIVDSHKRRMAQIDNSELSEEYTSLNHDQKRVVDKVMEQICRENQPIRLIVSGQGGTGKSRIIHVLERLVMKEWASESVIPVIVSAPTGLAAYNIGGCTIHRILSLPVEHGKPADYSPLTQDQLVLVRSALRGLKLLIIDEMSMVSSLTLLFIHLRLTEVMTCNDFFGGISVVFFADFLQLPPVKGNQPFIPVTFLEAKQRVGAVASLDIWQTLSYEELTINMRQGQDKVYAELLSSIKVGKITDEQYATLNGRCIAPGRRATVSEIISTYENLVNDGESPLILMPTTALCSQVNTEMMKRVGTHIHTLTAIDTLDTVIRPHLLSKVEAAYRKVNADVTRTAGLEKKLELCVGARIMLKRNKNVELGLVNGSLGKIVGFNGKDGASHIENIEVKFDKCDKPIAIERESCSFEVIKSVYYTRKQFPVMSAFAITLHKSQGLSLKTAIVDAGSSTFGCGMIYVGLSRVTSISGLYLIDLDKRKIMCDKKALTEYNRLRNKYTKLGDLASDMNGTTENDKTQSDGNKSKHLQSPSESNKDKKRKRTIFSTTTSGFKIRCTDPTSDASVTKESCSQTQCQLLSKHPEKKDHINSEQSRATNSTVSNMYQFCEVTSLNKEFQKTTCQTLNLGWSPINNKSANRQQKTLYSDLLEREIYNRTGVQTIVNIMPIKGDGNCLFRALSLALTGSQSQHSLIRSYIVNHMKVDSIQQSMQKLVENRNGNITDFDQYLLEMQSSGTWGTEQEILCAAHLFQCSIICYSKYGTTGDFCLQHFPPHFVTTAACTDACKHNSLYLINSSGCHYECAKVTKLQVNTEE